MVESETELSADLEVNDVDNFQCSFFQFSSEGINGKNAYGVTASEI